MKCLIFLLIFLILFVPSLSQQTWQETALAINVEVPVRVFDNGTFVGHLTIEDFEIYEDNVPQTIEAVYLIKKERVLRKDEIKAYKPQTTRNFFLILEVNSYSPKLQDAMEYFIHKIYIPGDDLVVVTSMKTYRLKEEAKKGKSREDILKELKSMIRPDAIAGTTEFRTLTQEFESLSKEMKNDIDVRLGRQPGDFNAGIAEQRIAQYASLLSQLQTFRQIDELRLFDLAKYLKTQDGQNYVFIFYEKKYIPQVDPTLLQQYMGLFFENSYIEQTITDLLDYNKQENILNVKRATQAFADASTAVHFLHISTSQEDLPGVHFEEYGQNTFNILLETSQATGGISESSTNPDYMFKQAVNASENYYLLYYTPKNYAADGNFKRIEVKVKGDNKYEVKHRLGYFAD
jgi:VWFA-related protein